MKLNKISWKFDLTKIPISQFDIDQVVIELDNFISNISFNSHFRSSHYSGEWSSFSLRSGSGNEDDAKNSLDGTYKYTDALKELPHTKSLLQKLENLGRLRRVRLLKLVKGSKVEKHIDLQEAPKRGVLRIHLPIITNERYVMTILNHLITWPKGRLSVADFSVPHALENNGPDRTHLVIDLDGSSSITECLIDYQERNLFEKFVVFVNQFVTSYSRKEIINFLIGWYRYGR